MCVCPPHPAHPHTRLAVGPSFEPGGAVFAVCVLFVASSAAGAAVARFPPMPALVGQLVVGFLLRNLPRVGPSVGGAVDVRVSASARTAALGVILARAGVSLDLPAVWRLRWPASRLAFAPSTAEALVVTLVSQPLLGLPWTYAAALGFLFAAISPAVVIPSLLSLQDRGYGADAGVAALVITAASVDVVYAIAGFGVASSLLFVGGGGGAGGAAEAAWRAPVQLVAGVAGGAALGAALGASIPVTAPSATSRDEDVKPSSPSEEEEDTEATDETEKGKARREEDDALGRSLGLLGLSLAVLFAGSRAEVDAAGGAALAVVVMAAAAARAWGPAAAAAVSARLNLLWLRLAQPLLFALVGAAVDLSRLSGDVVGRGLLVLGVGLAARGGVAFLAAGGGHLGFFERVFVAVAWMPKATVQAALAGLPYDAAVRSFGRESEEAGYCEVLLALGVLAVAVTAPLGAAAVSVSGERLLTRRRGNADAGSPGRRDGGAADAAGDSVERGVDAETMERGWDVSAQGGGGFGGDGFLERVKSTDG